MQPATEQTATTSVTVTLSGLSCASCAARAEKALRATAGVINARVNLATSHAHLGRLQDARNDVAKVEQLVPGYSIKVARDSCVFVNNTDIDRFIDGLRKAGLGG